MPAQPKAVVIAPPNTRVIALPSRLQNRSLNIPLSVVVPQVSTTLVLRNGATANPQAGWGSTDWTFVAGPRTVTSPSLITAGAVYPTHGGVYGGTGFYSPRYYSD
ncbi:hypothetical protein [Azospirillum canadense]|uniref:hypothetical protein n=1 Tax=Azospirillum canadense TaxID=403962 RepID=UPI0022269BE3|nr:hypothetical protein [Azospirillum canadense]MCW2241352.1 hypothetical protein [Azospirillum canadense]